MWRKFEIALGCVSKLSLKDAKRRTKKTHLFLDVFFFEVNFKKNKIDFKIFEASHSIPLLSLNRFSAFSVVFGSF